MKIAKSQVTKMVISEVNNLDIIAVYLEDYAPGAGKITITCFSSSWTHYWGHMGLRHNISSFIRGCSNDYLTTKLMNGAADEIYDLDKTIAYAKDLIVKQRKLRLINSDEARDLFDLADQQQEVDFHVGDWYQIFGEEYWYEFQKVPSSDYIYLCKILDALKAALEIDAMQEVAA